MFIARCTGTPGTALAKTNRSHMTRRGTDKRSVRPTSPLRLALGSTCLLLMRHAPLDSERIGSDIAEDPQTSPKRRKGVSGSLPGASGLSADHPRFCTIGQSRVWIER